MSAIYRVMGTKKAAEKWGKSQSHIKNTILAGDITELEDGILVSRGLIEAVKIGREWLMDIDHQNPFEKAGVLHVES